jgi:pilus assembly protein Flp/PilA
MPGHSVANSPQDRPRCSWRRFCDDERAVTAVEYGLMVALISVAIIVAVNTTGQSINAMLYGQIITALTSMTK